MLNFVDRAACVFSWVALRLCLRVSIFLKRYYLSQWNIVNLLVMELL